MAYCVSASAYPIKAKSEKQAAQEPVQDHEPTKDRRKNVPFLASLGGRSLIEKKGGRQQAAAGAAEARRSMSCLRLRASL